jgi:hypothetical protein
MGPVQGWVKKQQGAYNPWQARVRMGHMGQFNADMRLDWMGICVCASNNFQSKPFSNPYSPYISSFINKKILVYCEQVKINHEEKSTQGVYSWTVNTGVNSNFYRRACNINYACLVIFFIFIQLFKTF